MDPDRRRTPVLPRLYAALVAVVGIGTYLATETSVLGEPDGLSAVFLIVLTLPISALLLALPVEGAAAVALLVAGGLLQALGLHLLAQRRRRGRARPATS
jgi:hypothetical protein